MLMGIIGTRMHSKCATLIHTGHNYIDIYRETVRIGCSGKKAICLLERLEFQCSCYQTSFSVVYMICVIKCTRGQ